MFEYSFYCIIYQVLASSPGMEDGYIPDRVTWTEGCNKWTRSMGMKRPGLVDGFIPAAKPLLDSDIVWWNISSHWFLRADLYFTLFILSDSPIKHWPLVEIDILLNWTIINLNFQIFITVILCKSVHLLKNLDFLKTGGRWCCEHGLWENVAIWPSFLPNTVTLDIISVIPWWCLREQNWFCHTEMPYRRHVQIAMHLVTS